MDFGESCATGFLVSSRSFLVFVDNSDSMFAKHFIFDDYARANIVS